jgi:hypothetical protein
MEETVLIIARGLAIVAAASSSSSFSLVMSSVLDSIIMPGIIIRADGGYCSLQ